MEKIAKWQMVMGLALLATSVIVINAGFYGSESHDVDTIFALNSIVLSEFLMYGGLVFLAFGIAGATILVFRGSHLTRPTKLLYGIGSVIGAGWVVLILYGRNV